MHQFLSVPVFGCTSINIYHIYYDIHSATPPTVFTNLFETWHMFSVWSEDMFFDEV